MNKLNFLFCITIAGLLSNFSCYCQEQSRYKATYQFDFLRDTLVMEYFRREVYVLQIGDKITKGFTTQSYYVDSLGKLASNLPSRQLFTASVQESIEAMRRTGDVSHIRNNPFNVGGFSANIYKDYKKKEIRVKDNISIHNFIYTDELKPQDWDMLSETATILGYHCQKAQCHYRGRDWEAWFTTEIPISEGPWKFYGLPGLVTKLYDSKNHYSFELIGFQGIKESIDTKIPKGAQKIERKEFLRTMFGEKGDMIINADMSKIGIQSEPTKRNYDYIERDY